MSVHVCVIGLWVGRTASWLFGELIGLLVRGLVSFVGRLATVRNISNQNNRDWVFLVR